MLRERRSRRARSRRSRRFRETDCKAREPIKLYTGYVRHPRPGRFQMSPKSFRPLFAAGSLAVIAATIVLVAPAEAQIQKVAKTASSTQTWVPSKTADGQPDLQ